MHTKFRLTLEKEVVEIAKEYVKEREQSLYKMVQNYFKSVTIRSMKIHKNNG